MSFPLTTKTVFMQRIADHVGRGYPYFVGGQIPEERWPVLCRKFSDLYRVDLGKDARYRRKKLGLGNAVLLGMRAEGGVIWMLLVTPGDHPAHTLEKLREATEFAIEVTGYELVRTTRSGSPKPVWSWRMTAAHYRSWRERIIAAVRHHDRVLGKQLWESLYHSPGFAGIRTQVGKLVSLFKREWQRVEQSPFPYPARPLYYVRRMRVKASPPANGSAI